MARAFAKEGAKIVIAEIDPATGQAVADELGPAQGFFCQTDVRDNATVRAMVAATVERWGRVDVLINNAGVFNRFPSEDLPEEELVRVMDINFKGAVLCSQAVAKVMIPQKSGRIISLSSINGLVGFPERLSYNTSKAAVDAMTRVLAIEWAEYNITVNAIAPGYVRTEAVAHHTNWAGTTRRR
jgi:NAD(P)-dependent dehydrogenase (short-subunit alcohol dehydrogenase family)